MNWDQIAGSWKQFQGKVREKWGKLTDDDLTVVAGKRDQLSGALQRRYGLAAVADFQRAQRTGIRRDRRGRNPQTDASVQKFATRKINTDNLLGHAGIVHG